MLKDILKRSQTLTSLVRGTKQTLRKRERRAAIRQYLQTSSVPKLQLGSGSNLLPGWLNTDGALIRFGHVFLDITERLPFADDTFEFVFTEHTIEHIQYKDAQALFREVHRVMKPGGTLRVTTPDLEAYLRLFQQPRSPLDDLALSSLYANWILPGFYNAKNYVPISPAPDPVFVLNDVFFNYEHRFLYTAEVLKESMAGAGFAGILRAKPSESVHAELTAIETHSDESSVHLTLAMEARK